jgi:hypothetical protein
MNKTALIATILISLAFAQQNQEQQVQLPPEPPLQQELPQQQIPPHQNTPPQQEPIQQQQYQQQPQAYPPQQQQYQQQPQYQQQQQAYPPQQQQYPPQPQPSEAKPTLPTKVSMIGGLNLTSITSSYDGDEMGSGDMISSSAIGFHVGYIIDKPLVALDFGILYFHTGIIFSQKASGIDTDIPGFPGAPGYTLTTKYRLNYLEIPEVVLLRVPMNESTALRAHFGFYTAFGLFGTIETEGDKGSISKETNPFFGSDGLNIFDFGLHFGGGIEFTQFYADLSYKIGLISMADTKDSKVSLDNSTFGISLGSYLPQPSEQRPTTRVGIAAGLNISSLVGSGNNETDNSIGFNAGLVVDKPFMDFGYGTISFRTGIMFSQKGGKLENINSTETFSLNYLLVPEVISLRIPLSESVAIIGNAGVYTAYGLFGTYEYKPNSGKIEDESVFGKDKFNRFDFGWHFGGGVDFKRFFASIAFESTLDQSYFEAKNSTFGISLGMYF